MKTNIIYNEDFLKTDKIPTQIPYGSIDMVITSPPYFNARDYSNWNTYEDYLVFVEDFLDRCYKLLNPEGRIAINIPDGYNRNPWIPIYADYCKILQQAGFILRGSVVWHKMNGGGKTSWGSWRSSSNPCFIDEHEMIIVAHKENPKIEHAQKMTRDEFLEAVHSVWQIKPETKRKWGHPAPYLIEIPERLIRFLSGEGAVILDPFMGSATTAIACKNLNRKYIGFEVMQEYYQAGLKRLKEF